MRPLARILLLAGGLGIAFVLFRSSPREVVLVYDLGAAAASELTVDLTRGGELIRRAEFRVPAGASQVRHAVKLGEGAYRVAYRYRGSASGAGDRTVEVRESGTVVLSLGP